MRQKTWCAAAIGCLILAGLHPFAAGAQIQPDLGGGGIGDCTDNPFDPNPLPLCSPPDPTGTTVGPEDLLDFVEEPNGTYRVVDISQAAGGFTVLGAPPSAILVGGQYHVFVPGADSATAGHMLEFIGSSSGPWTMVDLNVAVGQSFSSSVPAALLTSSGVEHVFTAGNGHMLDFVHAPGGPWTLTDISVAVGLGGPTAGAFQPVGLVAAVQMGADLHVFAFDGNQHLREYFLPAGHGWVTNDVSQLVGNPIIATAPSVLNLGNALEVYASGDERYGHLLNFQGTNFTSSGSGAWQVFDQTANSGGRIRFAGIPSYAPSEIVYGNSVQVFLDGGPNGTDDLQCLVEVAGQWQTFDLSTLASNGQALGLISQPFALVDGPNVHVYAPRGGGHLLDFFKTPNPANWTVIDLSSQTGRTVLGVGATAFKDPATGELHIFTNG